MGARVIVTSDRSSSDSRAGHGADAREPMVSVVLPTYQEKHNIRPLIERIRSAVPGLHEIIVTGTPGGTRRRAIGNSVASVSAAQLQETQITPDVKSSFKVSTKEWAVSLSIAELPVNAAAPPFVSATNKFPASGA